MITGHVYRPTTSPRTRIATARALLPCAYAGCGRLRTEHARAVRS